MYVPYNGLHHAICMPTSLPDQSADKTMPPPTASPAEKGSRPPTSWIWLVRAGLSDQPFLTLLVRSRHVKSNKEQLAMLHILTSPTLLRNLPNPHIGKYSAKGSTRNFKTRHHCTVCCACLQRPDTAGLVLVHTAQLLSFLLLEEHKQHELEIQ